MNDVRKKDSNRYKEYFKQTFSDFKTIVHNESHKSKEEHSRDLKALILTIIIVSIIIFIVWKVPFLHNLIFP